MTDTLTSLLDTIAAEQRDAGERVERPAEWQAISQTRCWMRDRLGVSPPRVLSELWRIRDGVHFNGMILYRPDGNGKAPSGCGIRAVNETFARVTGDRYLFVGEADMDAYVHDAVDGGWHVVDKVSLDSFERFETCRNMLVSILDKYVRM